MPNNPPNESCLTCRFWQQRIDKWGYCRRYPKAAAQDTGNQVCFAFPRMDETDWCGEYRKST